MKTDLTVSAYIIYNAKTLLIYHLKTGLWLPPGGHIEKDETPDEALLREIKQELDLEIKILNTPKILNKGNIIEQLAVPFYCNTHKLIDHIHYCGFYVCELLTNNINMKKEEIKDFGWFSKQGLHNKKIPVDVKNIGLLAFNKYKEIKNVTG
jgi:8-oxo-dGTP diphosphatase